jgi:hypothetical protein
MKESVSQRIKSALRVLRFGSQTAGRNPAQVQIEVPPLTPEEVAEVQSFFPCAKYFIFGHARSGTTLLTRLIRLHPEVHCDYQAHFFSRAPLLQGLVADENVTNWLVRRSNRWNRGKDLSPVVMRAAADFILEREARRLGKRIVGDKSPNSLLNGRAVQLMHAIYPDAALIYIVRDGRDAVVSHRFQQFIDVVQHLSPADMRIRAAFSENPTPYLNGERSIFTEKNLVQAVQGWVDNVGETDQMGRDLYGSRYISLRYEDLLKNPGLSLKKLWAFLGADVSDAALDDLVAEEMRRNPDADWQHEKAAALVSPLEKGKSGSWRSLFTARDRQVFKEIGGRTLIAWGYEKDLEW